MSPFFKGYALCNKYSAVIPFKVTHDATSSETPSGTGTSLFSGIICFSEYAPIGIDAWETLSPTLNNLTSGPTSSITPQASSPIPLGSGIG